MLIRRGADLKSSEITTESHYLNRREWIAAAGAIGVAALAPKVVRALGAQQAKDSLGTPYGLQKDDKVTPWEDVTGYNNYYEFGTGKDEPARYAKPFKPKP